MPALDNHGGVNDNNNANVEEEKKKDDDDDDDYMNMTFEDPTPARETLTQRKKRLAREAEIRGRPKSKAQLAAEEKEKREAALANSHIDTQSKGFKMMAALGYKAGNALGAAPRPGGGPDERLLEPIGLATKEGRGGIGADSEKKRKIREAMAEREDELKRRKVEESDFRARQQQEREEKKQEGQMYAAMKVCERLEDEDEDEGEADREGSTAPEDDDNLEQRRSKKKKKTSSRPLGSINVLWRGLVKERAVRERDARMRHDVQTAALSFSLQKPGYDPEEDEDDIVALARKTNKDRDKANAVVEEVALDLDEEDAELDEFQALPVADRLDKLVDYLRQRWHYCFWCKYRYPDDALEGCPGTMEEEHD